MNKFSKNDVPNDFTYSLVLVDALPVIAFSLNVIYIAFRFSDVLFLIGSILVAFAGLAKVIWKLIVVWKHKNVWPLFIQLRFIMPIGFALMLFSLIWNRSRISVLPYLFSFPSCIFFGIGMVGMILMMVFMKVLDSGDLKSNWIEQITNTIAQFSIFVGLLLI